MLVETVWYERKPGCMGTMLDAEVVVWETE